MLLDAVKAFGYVVDRSIGREDYTEERKTHLTTWFL